MQLVSLKMNHGVALGLTTDMRFPRSRVRGSLILGQDGRTLNAGQMLVLYAFTDSIVHHIVWFAPFSVPGFFVTALLSMHRRHTQNLAPLPPPQLSSYYSVHSGSDRVAGLADQHAGVVVKLDNGAVGSLDLLPCPHDDGVSDVTSLDFVGG